MTLRAKYEDVQKLVDNTTDTAQLFISMANTIVDEHLASSALSEPILTLIETLLAAHFAVLTLEKGSLAEKSIGEAKEKYHNVYKAGFSSTRFGQQAIALDTTGALATISATAEATNTKKALFTTITSPEV